MLYLVAQIVGIYLFITCSAEEPVQVLVCPVDSIGQYPDCICDERSPSLYDRYNNLCHKCGKCGEGNFFCCIATPLCPTISDGDFPNCECRHGPKYDKETNTCPNPECPANDSIGIYPNCTCLHKNFDYIIDRNECVRVCGGSSFGHYPHCTCSYGFIYDIRENRCTCEEGGIYNSSSNICHYCPCNSDGVYPNCVCNGGRTYSEITNKCQTCPSKSDGIYPNCICENGGTYAVYDNKCYECPDESIGEYPNCVCKNGGTFIKDSNYCRDRPTESKDILPNYLCIDGYYSKVHKICITCPRGSTGSYPNCKCHDENMLFSAFINQCYIECPDNSSGIHPTCQCDSEYFYDKEKFVCKSKIGRKCPTGSSGIGPDCLCMREGDKFDSISWMCRAPTIAQEPVSDDIFFSSPSCPDVNSKWPQCESSIDSCVLRSCIG